MAKVGCAGIVVSDMFCGPMDRLPNEGELLALDRFQIRAGGCAANVAVSLTRQGIDAQLAGCVGKDAPAEGILASLRAGNVDCRSVVYSDTLPTSQTVILLVKGQDRRFIHVFGANADFTVSMIDPQWAAGLDLFYLGGLFAMPRIDLVELGELLRFCREHHTVTVVDVVVPPQPKGLRDLGHVLKHCDYFLPNEDEAEILTGKNDCLDQIRALRRLGADAVIVTRGADGCVAAHDRRIYKTGVFNTQVVDPSGAGDAFTAGVIAGIVQGLDMPGILTYGSALGASATMAVGCTDSVFTAQQTQRFLETHRLDISTEMLEA